MPFARMLKRFETPHVTVNSQCRHLPGSPQTVYSTQGRHEQGLKVDLYRGDSPAPSWAPSRSVRDSTGGGIAMNLNTRVVQGLLAAVALAPVLAAQTAKVSFSREIAPLLAQCIQCHGSSMLSSNLDLTTSEGARKGGLHGPAIVPNDAANSHLYRRIVAREDPRMPYNGTPLTPKESETIKQWINSGAAWDKGVED
jgi:Planctomycete cytochrome C